MIVDRMKGFLRRSSEQLHHAGCRSRIGDHVQEVAVITIVIGSNVNANNSVLG